MTNLEREVEIQVLFSASANVPTIKAKLLPEIYSIEIKRSLKPAFNLI